MGRQRRSLAGKVVVVTGGAGGVGKALAGQLVREGAHVAICDLDAAAVESVVGELHGAGGSGSASGTALDLADRETFTEFIDETERTLGPLDVLINNAGIMPVGPFEEERATTAAKQIDVNLHAVLHGTKVAIQRMKPRGRGHIVNVASGAGMIPGAGGATYSATKFGVVGLTEALWLEMRETGVEISLCVPAVIKTQLASGIGDVKGLKPSTPDEVAAAIVETLKSPRFAIFVPKAMGVMAGVYGLLPYSARGLMARVSGADRLLIDADKNARAAYESAVLGGASDAKAVEQPDAEEQPVAGRS